MSRKKGPPNPPSPEAPYEVGYRKPPKEHRFKPGISGNIRGRPKAVPKPSEVMAKLMGRPITITENGVQKTIPRLEALLLQMINSGLKGNARATNSIMQMLGQYAAQVAEMPPPLDLASLTDEELKLVLKLKINSGRKAFKREVAALKKKYGLMDEDLKEVE